MLIRANISWERRKGERREIQWQLINGGLTV
jgi:hypothetical protein